MAGWRERAAVHLDVSPHAIAGALHDLEADALLTEAEVMQRLDRYLKPAPAPKPAEAA